LTNESRCPLARVCKLAGNPAHCSDLCGHYNAVSARMSAANMPSDYQSTTLRNSPVRANISVTVRVSGEYKRTDYELNDYLTKYVRSFSHNGDRRVKSLYIWGPPGTGKTTTACALLNEWIAAYYVRAVRSGGEVAQKPALFFDVNEWLIEYNLIAMGDDKDEVKAFKKKMLAASNVPFLVMDDLGVRKSSDNFRGYLHYIVNHRCANGLPTIYTSNIPLDELAGVFDARLADRVRDQCFEIELGGTSKRGIRK